MKRSNRVPEILLASYVVLALFCLIGPGYVWWGARVHPFVLGLPFSFAWHIGWVLMSCVALGLYHWSVRSRGQV